MFVPPFAGPSPEALRWAASSVGPGATVTTSTRLTGGITSSMHILSINDHRGRHRRAVLRQWIRDDDHISVEECVRREAKILEQLEATDIPAPRLLAADAAGRDCGVASLLMTHLPGRLELNPDDPEDWLGQLTEMLVRVHRSGLSAPATEGWLARDRLIVPEWSARPGLWRDAFAVIDSPPPTDEVSFIHHDYQQFNVLWRRGSISGVVDWVWGSTGSPDIDVAHLRLNLAVLYSSELAGRFLSVYERAAARTVSPWWDVEGLLQYLPHWGAFLQRQAGRRRKVDFAGMHQRVEETLAEALARC